MWTATLLRLRKTHGRIEFEISYTDGTQVVNKSYTFARMNKKNMRQLARNEIASLQAIEDEVIDVPVGGLIDLTPPAPLVDPPPTQAQIDRRAWFDDWEKLQILLRLVDAEILQPTDSRIDPLKVTLRAGLLNSYLSGI